MTLSGLSESLFHFYLFDISLPINPPIHPTTKLKEKFVLSEPFDSGDVFYLSNRNILNITFNISAQSLQVIQCSNGELLSMKLFNDGVPNCENGGDELTLFCFENGKKMNGSHCKNVWLRPNCTYTKVYYHNTVGGCSPYSLKRVMCNIMFLMKK